MAVIGAAHGIKGELRVKSFTADPLALGDYGPLHARDGRRFEVLDVRPAGTVVVVRFKGVTDRTAAEALNGTELFVDRSALPEAADEEEFYHADLVGQLARKLPTDLRQGRVRPLGLDRCGIRFRSEGADGDSDVRLPFPRPVSDVFELSRALRNLAGCPFMNSMRD